MPSRASAESRWIPAVAVLAIALILVPVARRLDVPYEQNYHGNLTAWFALMSENMVEHGFLETRFMPVLNPNPTTYPNYRYYLTHPVLDVVMRAGLIEALGRGEWVVRLQGLVGAFLAGVVGYAIARRWLSPTGALAAACGMTALPLAQRLAHLSMQHPMTIACGLLGLLFYLRHRERERGLDFAAMMLFLLLGMNFDWPGYFMPLLIWIAELLRRRRRAVLIGLPVLVTLGVALVFVHVDLIVDAPRGLLASLRSASEAPAAPLSGGDAVGAVVEHQIAGFGVVGLGAMALAPLLALAVRGLRPAVLPWLGALAYGMLHLAAFPSKAPYHDFWGCYGLPCAGLSIGILADAVVAPVRSRGEGPLWIARGLIVAACAANAWLLPWDERAVDRGADQKTYAAQVLELVPREDRGVFVTNYAKLDFGILMTYLRVNLYPDVDLDAAALPGLPAAIRRELYHARGSTCLFFVAPPEPGGEGRTAELIAALSKVGTEYRGMPNVFDITEYVWGEG